MILFPKRILPGVGAVDYRPHCVLTSAQTLMCSALLQTANAYNFMLVELFAQIRPSWVLLSFKQRRLYHHMLVELFAQIRDPHVFCSHKNNEGLFSSIVGVVFANINC